MQKDIRFYDMRYTRLRFISQSTHTDPLGKQTLLCKLRVKGSSENRPKISPGDMVYFRPAEEDLPTHALHLFEIRGVVLDFKLQNEIVTCLCQRPAHSSITTQMYPSLAESAPDAVRELLEAPRYHIRFTFDMCGGSIIQKALTNISLTESLLLTVFPLKDFTLPNPFPRLLLQPAPLPMDEDLNMEQREAVETVSALYLRGQEDYFTSPQSTAFVPAPPYIIFGPPGTGEHAIARVCVCA